jgi:hypothetical protein
MNFCYFIQTHKNSEQIYRLVNCIKRSSPRAEIIGHDAHIQYLPLELFESGSTDPIMRMFVANILVE